MKRKEMKKKLNKLNKTLAAYELAVGSMEAALQESVDFDLGIVYQPGDGFCVNDNDANNAPLDTCIEIINNKGRLSREDYLSICI